VPDSKLTVSFIDTGPAADLCTPSIAGGYLGAENQAVRVQITTPDPANLNQPCFTWGFDNASPCYRVKIEKVNGETIVTLLTEPKDQYHWPMSQQVVEILPWSAVLPNNEKLAEQSGFLSKVHTSYDPDNRTFSLVDDFDINFWSQWINRSDKAAL